MKKKTSSRAPLTLRVYAFALKLVGWLLFPGAVAFALLGLYVEGFGASSAYEIGAAVVAIVGMGAGALKWSESLSEGRAAAALGLCVVAACACGVPAWIYFAAGDAGLGWACVLAGSAVALPLLYSCLRNWKSLDKGGEIYGD